MTDPNKEKVLAKWPDAKVSFAFFLGKWVIRASPITGKRIGDGNSEPEAWADAARRREDGE